MSPIALLVALPLLYVLVLYGIARLAERNPPASRSPLPRTFALALGVIFTGWGYLGTGAFMLNRGFYILGTALGVTLLFVAGWPILERIARLAKAHRVTTLAGLLGVRYGHSYALTAFVAIFLLVAMLPYLALQFNAIAFALQTLAAPMANDGLPALRPLILIVALVLALVTILLGARWPDPTVKREGMLNLLAADAVVKLASLAVVVGVVLWGLPGLYARAPLAPWPGLNLEQPANSYANWLSFILLGASATAFLPHVYHLLVVESPDEAPLQPARWVFPLYFWLIFVFVVLVALAGAGVGLMPDAIQASALLLPLRLGQGWASLIAFIGAVSAALCMTVMSLTALANSVVIDLLVPLLTRRVKTLGPRLLPIRWGVILLVSLMAWGVWAITDVDFLVQFGLISHVAVAQLAPAVVLGLVWPRATRKAIAWGLVAAALLWFYTAVLPSMSRALPAAHALILHGPWGVGFLRPVSLFGLAGWDPHAHAFFWCTLVNLVVIAFVTWRTPRDEVQSAEVEALLAERARLPGTLHRLLNPTGYPQMEAFLAAYVGAERADAEMTQIRRALEPAGLAPEREMVMAREAVTRVLSGPLGTAVATLVVQERFPVAEQTVSDVMDAYLRLEQTLALSREDLTNRVRDLSFMHAAAEHLVTYTEPDELLVAIAALLRATFPLDLSGILLIEEEGLRLYGAHGFSHLSHRELVAFAPETPFGECLRSGKALLLTSTSGAFEDDPLMRLERPAALAYVPIAMPDRSLGVIACGVRGSGIFLSPGFMNLLQGVANELAIALSNAQSREREAIVSRQLDVTLNNLADAVLVVQPDMRILLVNDAMLRLFQIPDKAFIYRTRLDDLIVQLKPHDLEGRPITRADFPRVVTSFLAMAGTPSHGQFYICGLEGRELVISISSVPVFKPDGTIHQVVTVYRDITELYQLKEHLETLVAERTDQLASERDLLKGTNEKLEQAIAQLRNLDKVKGGFINAISHDLRIPLTGIVGYAEFLEEGIGGELNEQQLSFARQIQVSGERMKRLLDELLDFARMEAGRFKVEPRPLAYAELVEQALDAFRPAFEKKRLRLDVSIREDLPAVMGDPDRIIQILSNLLSNAVKFTPEGGAIALRVDRTADRVTTEVADTGVGIAPEDLPHMFERFYQTEEGRKAGGTGLGLAITKNLVEALGGEIGVESRLGVGSAFRFSLPLA